MRHPVLSSLLPSARIAAMAVLAVAVLGASGCGWFRKDAQVYKQSADSRPLEVPPDLDMPDTSGAVVPTSATQSVMRSDLSAPAPVAAPAAAAAAPADGAGFTIGGSRDEVFERVGEVLAATEGVTIASRAQLLGVYDVNYQGSDFLVRVSAAEAGAYVSAVDPRGLPATGTGPTQLMATLQAAMGQ